MTSNDDNDAATTAADASAATRRSDGAGSLSPPRSPHAMAEAALAAAVAEQQSQSRKRASAEQPPQDVGGANDASGGRQDGSRYGIDEEGGGVAVGGNDSSNKRQRQFDGHHQGGGGGDVEGQVQQVWDDLVESCRQQGDDGDAPPQDGYLEDATEAAAEATEVILGTAIEALVRNGLHAFHDLESVSRDLNAMNDVAEARGRELHRLHASETQSRDAVANLLRAVETAKGDARDASLAAQIEARLRGEIGTLRSERDEAVSARDEARRKCTLLEEEVRLLRARLGRVSQEKVKIERDSRAAISLARSLDSHASSDTDYYKRKVAELNDRVQTQQGQIAEQKLVIDTMTRQRERTMSQNRLAQLRAGDDAPSASGAAGAGGGGSRRSSY